MAGTVVKHLVPGLGQEELELSYGKAGSGKTCITPELERYMAETLMGGFWDGEWMMHFSAASW